MKPTSAVDAEGASPAPAPVQEPPAKTVILTGALEWVLFGVSAVFLAHFASMYTQLPGLFGQTGLLPIAARQEDVSGCWFLGFFPSPELGMEVFSVLGMAVAAVQLAFPAGRLRRGPFGVAGYSLLWALWHDLVVAGGRFTAYQMDVLLLDAAPLCTIAAAGLCPGAVTFALRWLCLRLYLGGGAVKLLSCDESWRNLSALHWHFQSQPLPNPIGSAAHLWLPDAVSQFSTLAALVVEIGVPFLFLAPSGTARVVAFGTQAFLQVGIALAGNFGPFNALTCVLCLSLLDDGDLPPLPGTGPKATRSEDLRLGAILSPELETAGTGSALLLALCATAWTLRNTAAACNDTFSPVPLVYGAFLLSPVGLAACARSWPEFAVGLGLLAGSAWQFARGLGVVLPVPREVLAPFNLGASSYGLFARMTGVSGRPTEVIEVAQDLAGPWLTVPFRYQVMETTQMPPLCFPHFPRLDWTHWFTPLGGEDGDIRGWLGQLLRGISAREPSVVDLLDGPTLRSLLPDGAPAYVRLSPATYTAVLPLDGSDAWWLRADANVAEERAWEDTLSTASLLARPQVFSPSDLQALAPALGQAAWPGMPLLRTVANGGGEVFIWVVLASTEVLRRAGEASQTPVNGGGPTAAPKLILPSGSSEPPEPANAVDSPEPVAPALLQLATGSKWISVSGTTEISGRSAAEAFAVYASLPNHPRWSLWLMKVTEDERDGTSEWAIRALTFTFKWTAKITEKRAPECIAWESTSGIKNRGKATFADLPGENPGCAVELQVSFQAPGFVRRLFASGRVNRFVEKSLNRDLNRFRRVVLEEGAKAAAEPPPEPLVDTTHSDRLGSCHVLLQPDGRIDFELRGFGTSGSTESMLQSLSEGMLQLDGAVECRCLIDMTRGSGCSPFAVPCIIRFLRTDGDRIKCTAVLGPRPLMALARLIAQVVQQSGVQFFGEMEAARAWLSQLDG